MTFMQTVLLLAYLVKVGDLLGKASTTSNTYEIRAVSQSGKLHVQRQWEVLHHVDVHLFFLRFSVEAVLPCDIPDDGIRLC